MNHVDRSVLDHALHECSVRVYETAPERLREIVGGLIADIRACDEKIGPDGICDCGRSIFHALAMQLLVGAGHRNPPDGAE